MKIHKMDKMLLDINQIKNIISIDYKDIYYNGPQERRQIMPGFLVFYDHLKHLFLTVNDPYFEDFVRRIKDVYLEEKDNIVLDGILGPEKISINPFTKTLLLNGNLDETSSLYCFYKGKENYSESLLFEEDKVKNFFPIVEYHLKETLQLFDKTLGTIKLSSGVNGTYYINTTLNNTPIILPISFLQQEDNQYQIIIGNLLDDAVPIKMNIQFSNDSIIVSRRVEEYDISDITTYELQPEVKKKRDVYVKGQLVVYDYETLKQGDNPIENVTRLDNQEEKPTWYILPWNAYIGIKEKYQYIDEEGNLTAQETVDQLTTKQMIYVSQNNHSILVKDMTSKRYQKRAETIVDSKRIVFDYLNKTIHGIKNKDGYIMETTFEGPPKTGFYQTNLDGKYFYHISPCQTELELNENSLTSLSKQDGLEEKTDLLEIKKYEKK